MSYEFPNPFKPGAGHPPPYLAGREEETEDFLKLLEQSTILDNMVLTGLRGTGKTVLLESFKPAAQTGGWLWAGTDLSESASIDESNFVKRLLADMALVTRNTVIARESVQNIGFTAETETGERRLDYSLLEQIYKNTAGLEADKLKAILEFAWEHLQHSGVKGVVFAYDEAQNLTDHAVKDQYPLSMLLDVFQSIQRKGIPFILVLAGLSTLFPKLVKARTYSERMFHIVELGQLSDKASKDAILKPIENTKCPVTLQDDAVETIVKLSGGYPYFIQFICKEVFDVFTNMEKPSVPVNEILRKLDSDFFMGRWSRVTDRQRDLLILIAKLENSHSEFTVRDIVDISTRSDAKPFSSSGVNQMLNSLSGHGLVFKNRHGKYSFAVPLMRQFILREIGESPVVI